MKTFAQNDVIIVKYLQYLVILTFLVTGFPSSPPSLPLPRLPLPFFVLSQQTSMTLLS